MSVIIVSLFILGCILIIAELFVPGFGFFGISGILALILGVIFTLVFIPGGFILVLFEIAIIACAFYLLYYYVKKTGKFDKLILSETGKSVSVNKELNQLVGTEGICIAPLKLCGSSLIEGKIYETTSINSFIEKDKKIIVKYVKNNMLYVDEVQK